MVVDLFADDRLARYTILVCLKNDETAKEDTVVLNSHGLQSLFTLQYKYYP